jgi:hypothetical protein
MRALRRLLYDVRALIQRRAVDRDLAGELDAFLDVLTLTEN